jgi:purine-binding chemotaxis protein CheW
MAEATANEAPELDEAGSVDDHSAQYMTFTLADEAYGVDILRVQEIRGWEMVTRIPNAPDYVKGVINLRGAIVPIFDLRQRFNLPVQEYTKDTVVIVLRVSTANNTRIMGVVVDAVSDVLSAKTAEIGSTPDFGGRISTEFISGLASAEGKMIMLLDVDKLLSQGEGVMEGGQEAVAAG